MRYTSTSPEYPGAQLSARRWVKASEFRSFNGRSAAVTSAPPIGIYGCCRRQGFNGRSAAVTSATLITERPLGVDVTSSFNGRSAAVTSATYLVGRVNGDDRFVSMAAPRPSRLRLAAFIFAAPMLLVLVSMAAPRPSRLRCRRSRRLGRLVARNAVSMAAPRPSRLRWSPPYHPSL
jgi:hypothetical protein